MSVRGPYIQHCSFFILKYRNTCFLRSVTTVHTVCAYCRTRLTAPLRGRRTCGLFQWRTALAPPLALQATPPSPPHQNSLQPITKQLSQVPANHQAAVTGTSQSPSSCRTYVQGWSSLGLRMLLITITLSIRLIEPGPYRTFSIILQKDMRQ